MVPAGIAQLAEQLICNQQVAGSIPVASSKKDADSLRIGVLFICYMLCVAFGSSVLCGKCFPRTTAVKIAGGRKAAPGFYTPSRSKGGVYSSRALLFSCM